MQTFSEYVCWGYFAVVLFAWIVWTAGKKAATTEAGQAVGIGLLQWLLGGGRR